MVFLVTARFCTVTCLVTPLATRLAVARGAMRYSVAFAGGATRFSGASQLNALSVGPWNVHSAAAGVAVFCGLAGLSESASVAEAPDAPDAPDAPTDTAEAGNTADATCAAEAATGAFATEATEAAESITTTCSIDPSTTTREPSIPAPA